MALATVGFAATFWVWALLASLGPELSGRIGLSPLGQGVLAAVPFAIGSLGRFPVGVLTDRYGARLMLPTVSMAGAAALVGAAFVDSMPALVLVACALGIAGTMFAIGFALVSRSCSAEKRSLALGVFGTGVVGAAAAGVTVPRLAQLDDYRTVLLQAAAALAAFAVVAAAVVHDRPAFGKNQSMVRAAAAALRVPAVPRLALLYAAAYGTMIAAAVYLPVYLRTEYGLAWAPAVSGTAVFVATAAAVRPVGGWLVDRQAPARVLAGCFGLAGVCVLVQAFAPPLPSAMIALAGIAVGLGVATGVLLAMIGVFAPPERAGAVAGAVGVAGGITGLVSPLLMAAVYAVDGSFGIAMTALSALLLAVAAHLRMRPEWIDAPSGRIDPPYEGDGPIVVAIAWADLRRNLQTIAGVLAELARHHELLIVHGADRAPTGNPLHTLAGALHLRLPRHRIVPTLVGITERAGHAVADLIGDLLEDGAVAIAVAPTLDPEPTAALLAKHIGATRVLHLTTTSAGRISWS